MLRILSFPKVVIGNTRAAIMGLKDDRHIHILEKVHSGEAHFYVLRKYVAHAKLYLLSDLAGHTRVIIGSANLSERAFSGRQSETLVKFDNDEKAWEHYNRMFDELKNASSDEIPLPMIGYLALRLKSLIHRQWPIRQQHSLSILRRLKNLK